MLKRLSQYLFDVPEEIGFDNFLVQYMCFIISIVGLLGSIISVVLKLSWINIISTLTPAVAFAGIYLYSKHKKKFILSKYILVILSIIVINIQWSVNFGSYGPILYLFVVIQSFIIILFNRLERILFTLAILVNVSVLFYIEKEFPDLLGAYSDNNSRLIDLYWGMLIYLSLASILIGTAITFYVKQKDKAQEADRLKSSFLANMSHEIRTPMNAIIGFGQLLNESEVNEKQRKYLDIIHENSFHLLKLIDDIIDISKIEANQVKIINEEFSVDKLFESASGIIQQYLEKHKKQHLQLICNNPVGNLYINSDYTRVKQILTNLLSNAAKFTEQGSIVFGCETDDHQVTFYVQDSGIGIEKKDWNTIFNRFEKIENPENEKVFMGAGIGLPISKQLVELMNGKIWLESQPGTGSRFSFSIPVKFRIKDKIIIAVENSPGHKFSGELILIAEDDDDSYDFLARILKINDLNSVRAKNGLEAIELCKTLPGIRLVLMDIKMPKMNGYGATIKIKEMFPDLPVIAQTAFAMRSDEQESIKAGCDDFVSKPINSKALLSKIRVLLH